MLYLLGGWDYREGGHNESGHETDGDYDAFPGSMEHAGYGGL